MSIDVSHGYKIAGISTVSELLSWWGSLYTVLAQKQSDLAEAYVGTRAVRLLDHDSLGMKRELPDKCPAMAAIDASREEFRLALAQGSRHPESDFEFRLSVISHDGTLYAILITEQPELRKAFRDDPHVQHYPYWNQTDDVPDGLTWEEWTARGQEWRQVMEKAKSALVLELADPRYLYNLGKIPQIPVERRAAAIAKWALTERYFQERTDRNQYPLGRIATEVVEWIQHGEGRDELSSLTADYAARLRTSVTPEDLWGK